MAWLWAVQEYSYKKIGINFNSMAPSITIGLLTYNYASFIGEAIESVLAQSRQDWELIICDDASTDETAQIVAPYLTDPRIRYVQHENNLGQGGNWGFALEQGTAPVVAVLHADDRWLPETLATVLPRFEADNELDLVYGNWWCFWDDAKELEVGKQEKEHTFSGHEEFRYQVQRNTCLASAAFQTRRVAQSAGVPRTDLKMAVDQEYFLRVAFHAHRTQAIINKLTLYRIHSRSTTAECTVNGRAEQEQKQLEAFCTPYAGKYPQLKGSLRDLRRGCAAQVFSAGVTAALRGKMTEGRRLMLDGLLCDPTISLRLIRLLDFILCYLGPTGILLLRRLHHRRVSKL